MAAQSIIAGGLVKVLRLFEIPYEIRHFGSKVFRTQMDIAIINFDAGIVVNQETTLFFKRVFESENKITVLGCDKALKRCTNFMSMGRRLDEAWLAENRAEVCRKCQTQQRVLKESQNLYLTSALDGLTDEQRKIISDLKQYKAFDISRLMALEYQGAPLGRLAFYDFSMLNKLSDKSTLSESQYAELLEHLSDAFHVWNFVGRAVSERHFDTALYINGNYSLNSVARERFKKAGIPCWSVEFSFSYSDTEKVVYLQRSRNEHSRDWEALTRVRDSYRCRLEDCRKALDGFRNRIYGVDFNSYSSPARTESWDKFDRFKSGYKEVVSIFVSSGDELQVHEVVFGFVQDTRFFKSQGEWLRFLIANANPEVGYVIRMHPRLAPNKRDSVRAEEYDLLTEAASAARNLPNFLVIEPEDPISSYYILLHSVMSVVSWSMIALESVVFGIPTVVCFPNNMIFPIEKMCPQPLDLDEIKSYLRREFRPERSRGHDVELMKWIALVYGGIGLKVPGVRYAKGLKGKVLRRVHRMLLSSRFLFSMLFQKRYGKRVVLSPNGDMHVIPDAMLDSVDQTTECLAGLEQLRGEAKFSFRTF